MKPTGLKNIKKTKNMNRDKIVDWLDNQIRSRMTYECMPENEVGCEYVPRHEVVKIVDGLIPMIKGELKKCKPTDISVLISRVRQAFADYYISEGCSCCRDSENHEKAEEKLAELLQPEKYDDDSGFDWYRYATQKN